MPLNKSAGPIAAGDAPWQSIPAARFFEAVGEPGTAVADLRDPNMAAADPLPGTTLVDYWDFDRLAAMASGCSRLFLVCGVGQRSIVAARELAARGVDNVVNVVGGVRSLRSEQ